MAAEQLNLLRSVLAGGTETSAPPGLTCYQLLVGGNVGSLELEEKSSVIM